MNTITALTQMKKESDTVMREKLSQMDNLEKMMYEMVLEKRKNLLISQALRIRKAIKHSGEMSPSAVLDVARFTFLDARFVLMHEIGLLLESLEDSPESELVDVLDSDIFDILAISKVLQCQPSELYVPRGDSLLYTVDRFGMSHFDLEDIKSNKSLGEESNIMAIADCYNTFFNGEIFKKVDIDLEIIDCLLESSSFKKHRKCSNVMVHLLTKMFNVVEDDSLRYKIFIILMYAKEVHYPNNPPAFGFEMRYIFSRNISFSDIEEGQKHLHLDAIVSVAIKRLYDQNCIDEDLVDEINILHPLSEHYYRDDVIVAVRQ